MGSPSLGPCVTSAVPSSCVLMGQQCCSLCLNFIPFFRPNNTFHYVEFIHSSLMDIWVFSTFWLLSPSYFKVKSPPLPLESSHWFPRTCLCVLEVMTAHLGNNSCVHRLFLCALAPFIHFPHQAVSAPRLGTVFNNSFY